MCDPTILTVGRTTYTVTKLSDDPEKVAYELVGPRGARYDLLRNQKDPHALFAVNGKGFTKTTPFEHRWFTDEDGTLRLL